MDNVPNPVCRHRMVQGGERRMIIWLMMALTVGGLVFAGVILVGSFMELPVLEDSSRFWDLLEIGLGGYIVGRFKTRK